MASIDCYGAGQARRVFPRTTPKHTMSCVQPGPSGCEHDAPPPHFAAMLRYHRQLLSDAHRTESFGRAVGEIVRPGDVVLDLGSGSGILALIAARVGARRVYAVEWGDIVGVARAVAARNGFSDRIEFIEAASEEVELPEPVDVITAEILGSFGLEENVLTFLPDMRDRFLKPGGVIVPSALRTFLALVEATDLYARVVEFWSEDLWGFDFTAAREVAASQEYLFEEDTFEMLARAQPFYECETKAMTREVVGRELSFEVNRPGVCHGLVGWFEAEVSPSVELVSGPETECFTWRPAFFPLSTPVAVGAEDSISVFMEAIPWGPEVVWNWEVTVHREGQQLFSSSQTSASGLLVRERRAGGGS